MQLISQHQESFIRLLNEGETDAPADIAAGTGGAGGVGGAGGPDPAGAGGPGVIQVTAEEKASIDRASCWRNRGSLPSRQTVSLACMFET